MEKNSQVHELLCRTRDSVRIVRGISSEENVCYTSPCFVSLYSRCGSKLALVDLNGLKVLRTSDYSEIMLARRNNIQHLHFSGCSRYLVSWEKPQDNSFNLIVWDINASAALYQFHQKKLVKEFWPLIVFNSTSTHFFMKSANDIVVYRIPDQNPLFVFNEIRASSFFVSPLVNVVVMYSGDPKGDNSKISVFDILAAELRKSIDLAVKYGQETKTIWNREGTRAVVWCQTDV